MASVSRKTMPIEECLFGPERQCPTNVWDAVGDDSLLNNKSKQKGASPYLGIDDGLDNGRWTLPENQHHVIPIQELRRIASMGITDQGSHRGVVWRVLLGGLPLNTAEWRDYLLDKRGHYRQLVADLFVEPQHDGNELRGHHGKKRQQAQAKRDYELLKKTPSKEGTTNMSRSEMRQSALEQLSQHKLSMGDDSNSSARSNGSGSGGMDAVTAALEMNPAVRVSSGRRRRSLLEEAELLKVSSNHSKQAAEDAAASNKDTAHENDEFGFGTKDNMRQSLTHTASEWIRQHPSDDDDDDAQEDDEDDKEQDIRSKDSFESDVRSQESLADMVPAHIREEWKKSGRDTMTLDSMSGVDQGMNTLLVLNGTSSNTPGLVSVSDDPLSTDSDSKWFQFFENASLLDEIRKDVVRTHPELYFFLEPENNLGQRRYAALERILFVWAKLNKGVRYVQGMNEIVGTIYYVFANDDNEVWACEAEADTYYAFNTLMSEMRDIFVPDLDEADTGIQGRISNMTALMSLHDPEVRCHLVDIGIDPAFYAIRWLTTLLSREFLLPDTIRLWDSCFASTHKENFMRYVCVTMVMIIRDKLLKGDFSTCLRLLQAYPTTNIDNLLEASRALWIYESQVTLACHKGGISLHQALTTITPPPSLVMAYGLPGGVARTRVEEQSPARGGFFSRANAMLGQIGREATRARSRPRAARPRTQTS